MTAPPQILAFLRDRHPAVVELALWTRGAVLAADPDLVERLYLGWDGIGFRHPEVGYVCGVFPQPKAVHLLFEHGRRLPDPTMLLEGDGTQTRYVKITQADEGLLAGIRHLVQAAVVDRLQR